MTEKSSRPPRPKTAVALEYDPSKQRAPIVAASGKGELAERIIAIARSHGIPVKEDPDLVQLLARLDVDEAIPPELYPVVAEVFAFIHFLSVQARASPPAPSPTSLERG